MISISPNEIITNILFFIGGFLLGEFGTRKLKMELFLRLKILKREYEIKIHHLYASILALIPLLMDSYTIFIFLLGIGFHDAILEIKKKIYSRLYNKT